MVWANMGILELESRFAAIRTVGSNPTRTKRRDRFQVCVTRELNGYPELGLPSGAAARSSSKMSIASPRWNAARLAPELCTC
jgi:hypothetical protein